MPGRAMALAENVRKMVADTNGTTFSSIKHGSEIGHSPFVYLLPDNVDTRILASELLTDRQGPIG